MDIMRQSVCIVVNPITVYSYSLLLHDLGLGPAIRSGFMYLSLCEETLSWSLFWCTLICVLYSFAIILTRNRELVAALL